MVLFLRRRPRLCCQRASGEKLITGGLIAARRKSQEKLAAQKGRDSVDKFEIGDEVVIQNPATRKWNVNGTIESKRRAEDGTNQLFIIRLEQG